MVLITSRKNPLIKEAAALASSVEKRRNAGLFLVEGARLSKDAAESGTKIFRLFYTQHGWEKYRAYLEPVAKVAKEVYRIEPHVADLLAGTQNSQGIYCVCEMRPQKAEIKGKIIVLEQLQDPANLGAVLRTGEAFGIGGFVLLGDCCDPYSPKAVRASMGAVFRSEIHQMTSLSSLKDAGYRLYAAVPDHTAKSVTRLTFEERSAVLIGNEGNGLTAAAQANADDRITIPMGGRAESLNAATAAAILMWEMVK